MHYHDLRPPGICLMHDKMLLNTISASAGDILLNHNLTTFHSRTTWQDGASEAEKRHMFRIWIASRLGWCVAISSFLEVRKIWCADTKQSERQR